MSFWKNNKIEEKSGETKDITVNGFTCNGCSNHVIKDLSALDEVKQVDIPSWEDGKTSITFKEGHSLSDAKIDDVIKNAGYKVVRTEKSESEISIKTPDDIDTDFLIIGTGGAGMGAAIEAAIQGKRVTIVEKGTVGGCCVNIGCVPSKMLIKQANTVYNENHFSTISSEKGNYTWEELLEERENLVATLRTEKYEKVIDSYPEITLVKAFASFDLDDNNYPIVKLDNGQTIKAAKYMISTGSKATLPEIDGIHDVEVMTSTEMLFSKTKPDSLIIIGGGVIALEIGQALNRLGVKIEAVEVRSRILSSWEKDITDEMTESLNNEGMTINSGFSPIRVFNQNGKKAVELENKSGQKKIIEADEIFIAMGRHANTDSLNLDKVAVNLAERSKNIAINDQMQTSNPVIYAGGDVADLPNLVYIAAKSGKVAANHAFGDKSESLDREVIPEVVFTVPQLARVGFTEEEAINQGIKIKTAVLSLEHVPKAIVSNNTKGLIKLIVDENKNTIIGAHIMSDNASDLIQTAAMGISMGKAYGFTIKQFREQLFPYLSEVEGLKLAAQMVDMDVANFSCCAS